MTVPRATQPPSAHRKEYARLEPQARPMREAARRLLDQVTEWVPTWDPCD